VLEVLPLLHYGTINFFSIPERPTIVVCRRVKDKFMVFSKAGEVFTWSMTTGKLLNYHKTDHDLTGQYQLFDTDPSNKYSSKAFFYDFSLLMGTEPVEVNEKEYFEPFLTERRSTG
jgi:hypothetical protein